MAAVGGSVKAKNLRDVLAVEGEEERGEEFKAVDEEEEQAEMPLCLPSVYQPSHSEYLDHCVTHYPISGVVSTLPRGTRPGVWARGP